MPWGPGLGSRDSGFGIRDPGLVGSRPISSEPRAPSPEPRAPNPESRIPNPYLYPPHPPIIGGMAALGRGAAEGVPLGMSNRRRLRVAMLAIAMLAGLAASARAQMFGVGFRMTSVSGAESPVFEDTDSSRTRLWGGFARLHLVGSLGFEVAMDYQSLTNDTETAHVTFKSPDGILVDVTCADLEAYAYAYIRRRVELERQQST